MRESYPDTKYAPGVSNALDARPTGTFEICVQPTGTDGPEKQTLVGNTEFIVVRFQDVDPVSACHRALLYAARTFGPREVVASVLPPRKD